MENTDVVVIGGGPSGCFAAMKLAQKNIRVTLCEEHPEIGIPCHCAGHLSIRGLQSLGMYPLPPGIIENTFDAVNFYSPNCTRFHVQLKTPVTCAVNRTLFDQYLSNGAQDMGAHIRLNSRVEKLTLSQNSIGVKVKSHGQYEELNAKMVIDAEGISSRLARKMGLQGPERRMIVNGVEAEVESVEEASLNSVEVYLGSKYAPGFYAWLIPKKEGKAKIGLATRKGNPKMFLEKLMTKHPAASTKLRKAKISDIRIHPITLGGPTSKPFSDRFLAVGDCVSQVKSTTGGGVVLGMTCAAIAAEIASDAIKQRNLSEFLTEYEKTLSQKIGFDTRTMVRIRKMLDAMSDRKLDRLISMCSRYGLEKTLKNVRDIDFQRRTLVRALQSPRTMVAASYFFLARLVGNP